MLVTSSLFLHNRDWVTYQMDAAQAMDKPLIAIEPFGGLDAVPDEVKKRAAEVVEWNERSIVDAVRRQARHEDTARWEVIEFEMPDWKP